MNKKNNTLRKLLIFILAPLFGALIFTACSDTPTTPEVEEELNIVETADEAGNFTVLLQLATRVGLDDELAEGELTLFAPTDDAFGNIDSEVLESLTDEQVTAILSYHVLDGAVTSGEIEAQQDAETLLGELVLLQADNGVTINNSSSVVTADIEASNGVIHAIDEVLLPSEIRIALGIPNIVDIAQDLGGYDILLGALETTGLTTTIQFLGPFTVFPPSDEVFQAFGIDNVEALTEDQLRDVLTYHVVSGAVESGDLEPENTVETVNGDNLFITVDGDDVVLNGSTNVVVANVPAANGVIHAVDGVLLPDALGNVVENAVKRYELTTLVELVVQEDLATTLSDAEAEFTVFAPTNEAFEEISETLSGLNSDQVTQTLLYHVLDAVVLAGDLEATQRVTTLNDGEEILVEVADGIVTINDEATVQVADVQGTNGVIHVIDAVLIPGALGGGAPDAESANITIENEGSSAWLIREIDGEGAAGTLDTENTELTLDEGLRFTVTNLGAADHPFQLRDADGNILIAAEGNGSLQDDEEINVFVDDQEGTITFTLTGDLAANVATYNCQPHSEMEGTLTVN